MNKKILSINMLASAVAFFVSTTISFFLSPYIIETLGAESYAFVKLANDFLTYISLLAMALNSMSTRFISVEYVSGNKSEAQKYYSSVFYANIIMVSAILLLAFFPLLHVEKIIKIPSHLVSDVKMVLFFVLINFAVTTVCAVFSVSIFIKNKLYLSSLRGIESGLIRVALLVLLFSLFAPKIYYIPVTSLLITAYVASFNIYYSKKLLPDIKIKKSEFDFTKIKTLIMSGIWNAVSQLSFILNEGLDLLICNLLIGPAAMGVLAIAKTVPAQVRSVLYSISAVFLPDLTNLYANNRMDELKNEINNSIKILGIIINVPIAGLIVFGQDFYHLWVPSQDAHLVQILSVLTVSGLIFSGSTATVHSIFTIANKVKTNSLVCLAVGLLNTLIVLILLKTTNLGLFAVAGVSTVVSTTRDLVFSIPYAAKCIGIKWNSFYKTVFRGAFCCGIVCIICVAVKTLFPINGWLSFFAACAVSGVLGVVVNTLIFLNKSELNKIKNKILKKI